MQKNMWIIVAVFLGLSFSALARAEQTSQAKRTLDAYAPFEDVLTIVASDDITYDPPLRGCIVGAAGNLQITGTKSDSAVTWAVVAGQTVPAMISIIGSSTTATGVCGR